jgi:hypothetical protein
MTAWWLVSKVFANPAFGERMAVSQDRLLIIPIYLLGGLSAMWCIERGLEVLG